MQPRRVMASAAVLVTALGVAGCGSRTMKEPPAAAIPPPLPTGTTAGRHPGARAAAPEPSAADPAHAFFGFDSWTLDEGARAALELDAKLLRERPATAITIEGHCDERGSTEYNVALGERRAQAAHDYLVAAGVEERRIRVISYGKERPFEEGHDESAWARNRRAHVVLR